MRFWRPGLVVLTLVLCGWPVRGIASRAERTVVVSVLDNAGAAVHDLKPDDITIYENGTACQATKVATAADPMAVVLLVDTSKPPLGAAPPTTDLRTGLTSFIAAIRAANPESKIALETYGGASMMTVDFRKKPEDLDKAVRRIFPGQQSNGVLLEGLLDVAEALGKVDLTRRAIVAIDFGSDDSSGVRLDKVAASVQKARAMVWGVSILSASGGSSPLRDATLDSLTQGTGGRRLTGVSPSALKAQLEQVADALVSQYDVTYTASDAAFVTSLQAAVRGGAKAVMTPWHR